MRSTITRACATLALAMSAASAQADILDSYTGKLAVSWWKWALETSASVNPVADTTGAHCAQGQSGPIWFLAGTFGTEAVSRSCTVPFGKVLFFPLVNSFYGAFLNDAPDARTEAYVRTASACTEPVDITLRVDNVRVPTAKRLFTGTPGSLSPLFNIQLPADNIYGVDESLVPDLKLSPSAEQGYYFFVPPLKPGRHTVRWLAKGCLPDGMQDITYQITVSAPR
jgi:hypothetical protein